MYHIFSSHDDEFKGSSSLQIVPMEMFVSLVVTMTGKEQLKCALIAYGGPLQMQAGTAMMLL